MASAEWPKWYVNNKTGEIFRRDSEDVYFWCERGTTRVVRQTGPTFILDGSLFRRIHREEAEASLHGTPGPEVAEGPPSGVNSDRVVVCGTYTSSDVTLLRQALDGERGEDQRRIAEKGLQIVTTLLRKNRDYGGSAHKRPLLMPSLTARQGILVRLSDKLQRLTTLLEKGNPEVQESLEDTFTDAIGYCMLWLTSPEEDKCDT